MISEHHSVANEFRSILCWPVPGVLGVLCARTLEQTVRTTEEDEDEEMKHLITSNLGLGGCLVFIECSIQCSKSSLISLANFLELITVAPCCRQIDFSNLQRRSVER